MDHEILERMFDGSIEPRDIPFSMLESITENFSEERIIGEGGFGTVYKGILRNREVALRRIRNNHAINDKLFRREVNSLLNVSHKNVVRFLGFCSNTEHKEFINEESGEYIYAENREIILCFEYINNGSLQNYIADELRGLEWDTRYLIIKGICDGLHYLHMEKHIIHMDLKPANILIDDNLVAKITDFGLSRMVDQTKITGRFVSPGYSAPEYIDNGRISVKCDLYSLGVIIIDLVTGHRRFPDSNNVLRRWRQRWQKSGKETPFRCHQVAKLIEIGLLCQESDPYKRPMMSEIICVMNELDSSNPGKISTYSEDGMLGIEPLELYFPFELNSQISRSLELTNEADAFIAFSIQSTSPLPYSIKPNKDIVAPRSVYSVNITLQPLDYSPQDWQHTGDFIVRSTKVNERLISEDITEDTFNIEEGKLVDEVNLSVTHKAEVPQKSNVPPTEAESKFCRDEAGQSIMPSERTITSRPSSGFNLQGHAEASRSTYTGNYLSADEPMAMTFQELHHITDGFSENRLLGKGGFGMVYKGVLDNGEVIAVKKLHNKPGLVEGQFKNELLNLMMVNHKNIIRLVGYCSEAKQIVDEHEGKKVLSYREERALCLEYLQGGNLEELLADKSSELDWEEHYGIIKGICQGLKHLHTGSKEPIYHLDLKPANILLDSNQIPKIGDFGLSRLRDSKETFVTKTYSGTTGYMPPEYMHGRQISSKFDVFSLGVIIIEIISGPEGYYNYRCLMSPEEFINHVIENWSKRMQPKTMSPVELLKIQRCIKIALRCVEDKQAKRPTITEIVEELNMIDLHTAHFPPDARGETTLAALSI